MTEPRWTYVEPADGPSTKLHLPGCRMMTETERLGRVRPAGNYWQGRPPWELGDLLCRHCWQRVDPLPKIKERHANRVAAVKSALPPEPGPARIVRAAMERSLLDADWLIAEVERLRSSG